MRIITTLRREMRNNDESSRGRTRLITIDKSEEI